jgi:hypothetical protein
MPLVQENIDRLNGNQYFTIIDMEDAYYHIPTHEKDRHKTGTNTPFGNYQYNRLAFGLAGAPCTFTKAINNVLLGLGETMCLIFMEYILIFSRTIEEHAEQLQKVFERLREASFTLNVAKYHFAQDQVEYLGHTTGRTGSKPSEVEVKVKAIQSYPRPPNIREARAFLGLSGYYRQYIPLYAELAQPLTTLLRKDSPFCWTEALEDSFRNLREVISSDTVLAYSSMDSAHEYRLHTDATDVGISAVLAQVQDGQERPVSFANRQLNSAERKLSVTEKELLAVVFATEQFRCYLYGRPFTLVTDHRVLCWLLKLKDPSAKLTRWALRLSEFHYAVEHRPGKHHVVPDALSGHIANVTCEEEELDRTTMKLEQDLRSVLSKGQGPTTRTNGFPVRRRRVTIVQEPCRGSADSSTRQPKEQTH